MQSTEYSAELDAFITTVRRFVCDELLPAEAQVDEDDDIPQHITNKLSRRDQPSVGRTDHARWGRVSTRQRTCPAAASASNSRKSCRVPTVEARKRISRAV